ncbi:MAG: hypothetical protein CVU38_08775 [Chloroflexi bacterium HGW-Chloroflexi-1]|nr:MAG: hypothetical protein CVU38_08775 [Chloroflexi bacterium HGW-Chloroflexi-1]
MVLMRAQKLELNLLGESVLKEEGWYTDAVRRFDGGVLLARGESWKRHGDETDRGPWWQVSRDGGVTWQSYVKPDDGRDHRQGALPLFQRPDGSLIGWADAYAEQQYNGRPGQPTRQSVVRAPSWEALIRGQAVRAEATVWLPYTVPGMGDDFKTRYGLTIWGKMVEAENGHLIQAAYSALAYDRAPRLWAEQKAPAFQTRTCVIYSQDSGATWHYLATVASPSQYPLPAQGEGYCEPDLLHFGAGHLLCVMRSGGNPSGTLMERYTPLMASRSNDGGLTWTPPAPIVAYGVKPVLLQMSDGLVVCLAGRPGFFLLFSRDEGRTWSTPHWVSESHGPWGRSASGYGELIELERGVLGVAYDECTGSGDGAKMVAKFRRYRIR